VSLNNKIIINNKMSKSTTYYDIFNVNKKQNNLTHESPNVLKDQLCLTSTPITTATETTTTVSVSISTVEKEIQKLKPIVDDLGTLVSGPAQPILNVS